MGYGRRAVSRIRVAEARERYFARANGWRVRLLHASVDGGTTNPGRLVSRCLRTNHHRCAAASAVHPGTLWLRISRRNRGSFEQDDKNDAFRVLPQEREELRTLSDRELLLDAQTSRTLGQAEAFG
jgi:hypothetical protein